MNKQDLIEKLNNFKNSYSDLLDFEDIDLVINDEKNLPFYPFEKSFDEINIFEWVNNMIKNLEK